MPPVGTVQPVPPANRLRRLGGSPESPRACRGDRSGWCRGCSGLRGAVACSADFSAAASAPTMPRGGMMLDSVDLAELSGGRSMRRCLRRAKRADVADLGPRGPTRRANYDIKSARGCFGNGHAGADRRRPGGRSRCWPAGDMARIGTALVESLNLLRTGRAGRTRAVASIT